MIPESVIEEVRERVDALEVFGRRVKLRKSGSSFVGPCPFHEEKAPSFRVYPDEKRFRCYGCQVSGDVFTFLQKLEGKEFPVVVRELAGQLGIPIPEPESTVGSERARKDKSGALAACEHATTHWSERLWAPKGEGAREFLRTRGVTEATAQAFRLGVAANDWHDLHRGLGRGGVSEDELERAGLVLDRGRGKYDRFRDRLMFPIAGLDGRIVGFAGRALNREPGAKWINTPETLLYKKGHLLYGMPQAKTAIRKTGVAILVEGYIDVVVLHQFGFDNAVGVCGTALSGAQLEMVQRCDVREIVILFDGDAAGAAAPPQTAGAIFQAGLSARVAQITGDPDDYVRQRGHGALVAQIAAAPALTEYLLERAIQQFVGTALPATHASVEQKIATVRYLVPHVLALPEGLTRSAFERRIAQRLALDVGALRAEVAKTAAE